MNDASTAHILETRLSYLPAGHLSWWTPPQAAPGCRVTWRKVGPADRPPRLGSRPPTSLWKAAPSPPAETWFLYPFASTVLTSRDRQTGRHKDKQWEISGKCVCACYHTNKFNRFLSPLISFALVSSCLLSSSVSLGIPSSSSLSLSNKENKDDVQHPIN